MGVGDRPGPISVGATLEVPDSPRAGVSVVAALPPRRNLLYSVSRVARARNKGPPPAKGGPSRRYRPMSPVATITATLPRELTRKGRQFNGGTGQAVLKRDESEAAQVPAAMPADPPIPLPTEPDLKLASVISPTPGCLVHGYALRARRHVLLLHNPPGPRHRGDDRGV
jgi:hypothetical protein